MSYPHSKIRGHRVHIERLTPIKPSARQKLDLSRLSLDQLQLMGKDVDIKAFKLQMRNLMPIDIADAIEDAKTSRTVAGASTLTVSVLDKDRKLLRSGRLASKQDVKIDGLNFRLVNPKKTGDTIDLIFEDREIAVLRTYAQPIKASGNTSRTRITRAQFILRMLREVKEFRIPYVIPELKQVQPIGAATDAAPDVLSLTNRDFGIGKGTELTVKGEPASPIQIKNAETILNVGSSMLVPRLVLVMAIMAAIQESSIINLLPGQPGSFNYLGTNPDGNPVGVFQQIKKYGWPASRDVAKDAAAFLKKAADYFALTPNAQLYTIIEHVQNSGNGLAYAQWRTEAERFVTAYGVLPNTQAAANNQWEPLTTSGDYEFFRGRPPVQGQSNWLPEDSWSCIQRLAQEVNWYAFFVSGTFYYISGAALFLSKPRARITEGKGGVDFIDFDYDENKKSATCTVHCRIGRWQAPPGAVVELYNMGVCDGRWLITDVERSLFDDQGTITLEKPQPKLPEPISDSASKLSAGGFQLPKTKDSSSNSSGYDPGGVDPAPLATELLLNLGLNWQDDNGRGEAQMRKIAAGLKLNGADGPVFMDARPIRLILWLISKGFVIGTYAWCEDHSNDGPGGHAGGHAVDISSINHIAINTDTKHTFDLTLEVVTDIHNLTGDLKPQQLISGGYGYHRDMTLSALSIPAADSFYGAKTMSDHTNHIHAGY